MMTCEAQRHQITESKEGMLPGPCLDRDIICPIYEFVMYGRM